MYISWFLHLILFGSLKYKFCSNPGYIAWQDFRLSIMMCLVFFFNLWLSILLFTILHCFISFVYRKVKLVLRRWRRATMSWGSWRNVSRIASLTHILRINLVVVVCWLVYLQGLVSVAVLMGMSCLESFFFFYRSLGSYTLNLSPFTIGIYNCLARKWIILDS